MSDDTFEPSVERPDTEDGRPDLALTESHAPMAYETFVLMKQAVEAQCNVTAAVTAERDQLKAEIARLYKALSPSEPIGEWEPPLVALKLEREIDQLKADNDKLRATVAAKDNLIKRALDDPYSVSKIDAESALSPEIANEFVRREVLAELEESGQSLLNTDEHDDAVTGYSVRLRFVDALSRAETELAKGKQP